MFGIRRVYSLLTRPLLVSFRPVSSSLARYFHSTPPVKFAETPSTPPVPNSQFKEYGTIAIGVNLNLISGLFFYFINCFFNSV